MQPPPQARFSRPRVISSTRASSSDAAPLRRKARNSGMDCEANWKPGVAAARPTLQEGRHRLQREGRGGAAAVQFSPQSLPSAAGRALHCSRNAQTRLAPGWVGGMGRWRWRGIQRSSGFGSNPRCSPHLRKSLTRRPRPEAPRGVAQAVPLRGVLRPGSASHKQAGMGQEQPIARRRAGPARPVPCAFRHWLPEPGVKT